MNRPPLRRTVCGIVLTSLLSWTAGCTSYQTVDDWREHPEDRIRVTMKDASYYVLAEWKVDSQGNLTGTGTLIQDPDYPWPFQGTIRAEHIAAVEAERNDPLRTVIFIAASAAVVVAVGQLMSPMIKLNPNSSH